MNRRLVVVPLFVAALLGLAACNNTTTGSGSPATTGTTTSDDPSTSSSGGDGGAGASTASLQPCDLLSSSAAGALQLTESGPVDEGGARACSWTKSVDINGQNGYGVEIGIRDSQGLQDIDSDGYTVTPDDIGSHQGRQAALDGGGNCLVSLGVGSSARVDVQVSGGTGTTQVCQFANQVAAQVEPQLPGGN